MTLSKVFAFGVSLASEAGALVHHPLLPAITLPSRYMYETITFLANRRLLQPWYLMGQLDPGPLDHLHSPTLASCLLLCHLPQLLDQNATRRWRAKEHSREGLVPRPLLDQVLLPPLLLLVALGPVERASPSRSSCQLSLLII